MEMVRAIQVVTPISFVNEELEIMDRWAAMKGFIMAYPINSCLGRQMYPDHIVGFFRDSAPVIIGAHMRTVWFPKSMVDLLRLDMFTAKPVQGV